MTLIQVLSWLKTFGLFNFYYISKIVGMQQNVLGVYDNASSGRPVRAIGQDSSYTITSIKLLIHGTKDSQETQNKAIALFNELLQVREVEHDGNYIYFVDIRCPEPIDVGMDTNNIYEFVINLDIYSRR